jgi:hypothetical protein
MNYNYYGHIVLYSVNDKGQYALTLEPVAQRHEVLTNVYDAKNVQITHGKSTIWTKENNEEINKLFSSNSTVFLVYNGRYGYDVYTGYNKVPNLVADSMCYMLGTDGRVKLAVIFGDETNTETLNVYIPEPMRLPALTFIGGEAFYEIVVYKVGETTPTTVLVPADAIMGKKAANEPEFSFGVFAELSLVDGVVDMEGSKFIAQFWTSPNYNEAPQDFAGHTFDIAQALTGVVNNSFPTTKKNGEIPYLDFDNIDDAQFFLIKDGKVTATTSKALYAKDMVAVFYDTVTVKLFGTPHDINSPAYVYLCDKYTPTDWDTNVDNPDDVSSEVTVNYTEGTVTDANGKVINSGDTVNAGATFRFVVLAGTTAPQVVAPEGYTVKLLNSNTASGTYTFELYGLENNDTVTIEIK